MGYKELLKKQIRELEQKIAAMEGDKADLNRELTRLKLAEFEEDIIESENQILLKG